MHYGGQVTRRSDGFHTKRRKRCMEERFPTSRERNTISAVSLMLMFRVSDIKNPLMFLISTGGHDTVLPSRALPISRMRLQDGLLR